MIESVLHQCVHWPMLPVDQGDVVEDRRMIETQLTVHFIDQDQHANILFDISKEQRKRERMTNTDEERRARRRESRADSYLRRLEEECTGTNEGEMTSAREERERERETDRRKNSQATALEKERPACCTWVRTEFKTDVSSSKVKRLEISSALRRFVT